MTESTSTSSALSGLKVLDLGTFISAPFSATLMAEFGADVIKIEQPAGGDSARTLGKLKDDVPLLWLQEAKNKRVITCDLRQHEGQEIVRSLVKQGYNVVIENFRPGTMEGWGLGYEALSALDPALIMLRISGYGQDGPNSAKPGFGRIANAFGGLTYLSGFADRPPVNPGSATLPDYLSGLFGALGILIAVEHRHTTGLGQGIDIPRYESVLRILDSLVVTYGALGEVRERIGTATALAAPHNHYRTADDRYVAIACSNDRIFARLCTIMEQPALTADVRFATSWARVENREAIDEIVESWTESHKRAELVALLDAGDVPYGPINSVADIVADPHVQARRSVISVEHEGLGSVLMPGILPRLSATPGTVNWLGRTLSADTHAVLRDVLGLDADAIAKLVAANVVLADADADAGAGASASSEAAAGEADS
jgi:crotonobetainyl-CoA:carnitine CoA-transferase CaiB-like acyl-CoA transferase